MTAPAFASVRAVPPSVSKEPIALTAGDLPTVCVL